MDALRSLVADLVLDTSSEGVWLIDPQARLTFVNRRLADMLGYTPEEMLGRRTFDFMGPSQWPIAERHLQERARGVTARNEIQLLRKDGTPIWVLRSANPVYDRDGNYAGALAVLLDLTPQKARERV